MLVVQRQFRYVEGETSLPTLVVKSAESEGERSRHCVQNLLSTHVWIAYANSCLDGIFCRFQAWKSARVEGKSVPYRPSHIASCKV